MISSAGTIFPLLKTTMCCCVLTIRFKTAAAGATTDY